MSELQKRFAKLKDYKVELIPPFPKTHFLLEVTNYCNDRCKFCANSKMTRPRGFIEPEIVTKVFREAYDLGMREVGFYATGEPLMNKNIFAYIKEAKDIGYEYTYITTNGALLDEEACEKLIGAGLDSIKFSINAGTREHYKIIHGRDDFDRVIANLKYVSDYRRRNNLNFKLYISFVVTNLTVEDVNDFRAAFSELVDEIVFVPVGYQGGMMFENSQLLLSEKNLHDYNLNTGGGGGIQICHLLFNGITVSCEGYLTACCVDFQNYLVIADLHHTTLKEAWESELFQDLRRRNIEDDLEGLMCYNCLHKKNAPIAPLTRKFATIF